MLSCHVYAVKDNCVTRRDTGVSFGQFSPAPIQIIQSFHNLPHAHTLSWCTPLFSNDHFLFQQGWSSSVAEEIYARPHTRLSWNMFITCARASLIQLLLLPSLIVHILFLLIGPFSLVPYSISLGEKISGVINWGGSSTSCFMHIKWSSLCASAPHPHSSSFFFVLCISNPFHKETLQLFITYRYVKI